MDDRHNYLTRQGEVTWFRLSPTLLLDHECRVCDDVTGEVLGFIEFADGMTKRFLAGLGATIGTDPDGPLVTTQKERDDIDRLLAKAGLRPTADGFEIADRDGTQE